MTEGLDSDQAIFTMVGVSKAITRASAVCSSPVGILRCVIEIFRQLGVLKPVA